MNTTPRVDALIERVMTRHPNTSPAALARYYEEVHQELTPLARELERALTMPRATPDEALAHECEVLRKRNAVLEAGAVPLVPAWRAIIEAAQGLYAAPWPPFSPARLPERNEYGFCCHPDYPDGDEDINQDFQLAALGFQTAYSMMQVDGPEALNDRYCEGDMTACAEWQPSRPRGRGWDLACIYDTEDGPCALFLRPQPGRWGGFNRWAKHDLEA